MYLGSRPQHIIMACGVPLLLCYPDSFSLSAQQLSQADLRDIDDIAVDLTKFAEDLHDQYRKQTTDMMTRVAHIAADHPVTNGWNNFLT